MVLRRCWRRQSQPGGDGLQDVRRWSGEFMNMVLILTIDGWWTRRCSPRRSYTGCPRGASGRRRRAGRSPVRSGRVTAGSACLAPILGDPRERALKPGLLRRSPPVLVDQANSTPAAPPTDETGGAGGLPGTGTTRAATAAGAAGAGAAAGAAGGGTVARRQPAWRDRCAGHARLQEGDVAVAPGRSGWPQPMGSLGTATAMIASVKERNR